MGIEPVTSVIRLQYFNQLSYEATTGRAGHFLVVPSMPLRCATFIEIPVLGKRILPVIVSNCTHLVLFALEPKNCTASTKRSSSAFNMSRAASSASGLFDGERAQYW